MFQSDWQSIYIYSTWIHTWEHVTSSHTHGYCWRKLSRFLPLGSSYHKPNEEWRCCCLEHSSSPWFSQKCCQWPHTHTQNTGRYFVRRDKIPETNYRSGKSRRHIDMNQQPMELSLDCLATVFTILSLNVYVMAYSCSTQLLNLGKITRGHSHSHTHTHRLKAIGETGKKNQCIDFLHIHTSQPRTHARKHTIERETGGDTQSLRSAVIQLTVCTWLAIRRPAGDTALVHDPKGYLNRSVKIIIINHQNA